MPRSCQHQGQDRASMGHFGGDFNINPVGPQIVDQRAHERATLRNDNPLAAQIRAGNHFAVAKIINFGVDHQYQWLALELHDIHLGR
ncbi:hypothetical protein D3C74_437950 [compost metagenome]